MSKQNLKHEILQETWLDNTDYKDDFRLAMRGFAGTVTIITARAGSVRSGVTATSVISVSMDPPSLLVSIHFESRLAHSIRDSGLFCVNVLTEQQEDYGQMFAGPIKGEARFSGVDWQVDPDGLPYLESAQSSMSCRVASEFQFGTHCMFAGEIIRVRRSDNVRPLIYLDGEYVSAL